MSTKVLTKRQKTALAKKLTRWSLIKGDKALQRVFILPEYLDGVVLTAKIAIHAEVMNHHPEIKYAHGKLTVTIYSHDTKDITDRDTKLAHTIDTLNV